MGQSATNPIGWALDPVKAEPLYRQIFDEVVARIRTGAFPTGFRLPPTRVLAQTLGAHRNTVARAYADLEAAGFVVSTVGRGTFIAAQRAARPADPAAKRTEPEADAMPWSSLLASAARLETLGRADRYGRAVHGREVVNLSRMQPSEDLIPHALMRRCIERVLRARRGRAMTYAPPEGTLGLREQIAKEVSSRGVPATPEDVLVTSGSQQALDLIARAIVNPGDAVLVDSTTYAGAINLFTLAGARLIPIPSDEEGPSLGVIQRATRADVKALYLMPNGHNPTGRTITAARRRELVEWSRAAHIPIIEDDYAAGLHLGHDTPPPHLRALDGEVIHVSTFSKRLIPALRVGFVVCPAPLRGVLRSMKRAMDLGASAILQDALAEFLERGYLRAHMNRILVEYRSRIDTLHGALRRAMPSQVTWRRPNDGIVLWLSLPEALGPERVYEEALRHGVVVSPSTVWSVGADAERGIRLAFCAEPADRLVEGAKRLGKAVKGLLARAPRESGNAPALMEVV